MGEVWMVTGEDAILDITNSLQNKSHLRRYYQKKHLRVEAVLDHTFPSYLSK